MHSTERAYLGVRARAFQIYREIAGGEKFKISVFKWTLYLRLVYWLHSILKLVYSKILTGSFASPLMVYSGKKCKRFRKLVF
jgi:hypothetical protein